MPKDCFGVKRRDFGGFFFLAGTDLLAAVAADGRPVAHPGPEAVAAAEETGEEAPPVAPQRPREDLVLLLLLVLLHVVRQVPAGGAENGVNSGDFGQCGRWGVAGRG